MTNGSVLVILGSLMVGLLASEQQAEGIKPFTTDIFKGFLAVFLLDMGITSGKKLSSFLKKGWFAFLFALIVPVINGCTVALTYPFNVTLDLPLVSSFDTGILNNSPNFMSETWAYGKTQMRLVQGGCPL